VEKFVLVANSRPIPVESSMSPKPSLQSHVQLNVCSLGWVIESNTLRP